MKLRKIMMLVLLVSTLASLTLSTKPQLNYLVALNMEAEFMNNGIVRVTLKQHPFDASGRSLLSNRDVISEIMDEEDSTVSLMLLFFTSDPSKAAYHIVSHSKLDEDAHVLCNTGLPGVMDQFEGAVTLTIEIFLNTTSSFARLDNDVYQIAIVDYFTLRDPRSWIDVIDLRFKGDVKLLNFSADPSWSKPPSVANSTRLQWLNTNEADAPDNYVLTLEIPGIVFSSVARRLKAEILGARFSNVSSSLLVNIRNTGDERGFFIVVLSEAGYEQARKINLNPGESAWVRFPIHVEEGEEVTVRVFGDKEQLGEDVLILKTEAPVEFLPINTLVLRSIGLILVMLGVFIIILYLQDMRKEQIPISEAPPPMWNPSS
ncbi:MAG: hypothetical protein QXW09_08065 [Thermoproteota archaeon]